MELKQLRYFVTVVDEGTISAAAKRLYMSQPPLSTQMKLLEKELGCPLFVRGQNHITLTETGRLLYDRAQAMLRMEQSARQDISACFCRERDTIRLGVVSSVICTKAGEWISDFMSLNNGHVRMEITENNTYTLIEKLRSEQIHAAIVRTPFPDSEFIVKGLSREKMIAVVPTAVYGAAAQPVTMSAVAKTPLILYRRWERIITEQFSEEELEPHVVCLCDDARTAVYLAEHSVGVSIVPASAARLVNTALAQCLEITDCPIETEIVLLLKRGAFLPESVKLFAEYLDGVSKSRKCKI